MADALLVIREALEDIWEDIWTTALVNLIWLLAVGLVLPAPSATLALFYYSNRRAHGEAADLGDFIGAFRRWWSPAWRWGLVNLVLAVVLAGDVYLTGRLGGNAFSQLAQGFYLALGMIWLLVQLYALPFLFEQEIPGVRLALQNGAAMLGRNLVFSILVGLLAAALLFIGAVLFMLSLAAGGVFLAGVGNHAVLNRLEAIERD